MSFILHMPATFDCQYPGHLSGVESIIFYGMDFLCGTLHGVRQLSVEKLEDGSFAENGYVAYDKIQNDVSYCNICFPNGFNPNSSKCTTCSTIMLRYKKEEYCPKCGS